MIKRIAIFGATFYIILKIEMERASPGLRGGALFVRFASYYMGVDSFTLNTEGEREHEREQNFKIKLNLPIAVT